MVSLMVFNTDHHTIPASVPYLTTSEPIPDHLSCSAAGGLSIGLVWASNPDNKAMYRNKSSLILSDAVLFQLCN